MMCVACLCDRLLRRLRVWDRITGYCRSVKLKYQANIRERQHAFERRCDLVKHKFTRMQVEGLDIMYPLASLQT